MEWCGPLGHAVGSETFHIPGTRSEVKLVGAKSWVSQGLPRGNLRRVMSLGWHGQWSGREVKHLSSARQVNNSSGVSTGEGKRRWL